MTPNGAGIHGSIYHSHSFDSWAVRLPGWKVVCPSNAKDAYGLMISSILDPNPVMYLKPKALLRVRGSEKIPGEPENEKDLKKMIDAPLGEEKKNWKPKWPKLEEYKVPLGKGKIVKQGEDLTVVSFGRSFHLCLQALKEEEGVELIDLRSLYPYDWSLIKNSIEKTGKVLFVNEDTEVANFCEHLAGRVVKELFYHLEAPPEILSGKQVPGIGLHPNLEKASVPQISDIKEVTNQLLNHKY